ncbi:MAG TPA: glutamine amidotransferase [Vicinamibacteria bacterium]|nr:glutamine amidotransferase [Vicinamibacteria bacterium]
MARVYYVGDWAVLTGPVFAETPFYHSHKGLDVYNYGHWLKSALEATGEHEVASVPSWDFYNKLGPGGYEKVLAEHDVFVFSDVDAKLFQLAPSFFDRSKFGAEPLVFPDRVRLTLDAVRRGKGLMLLGGWYSFTGEMGKGGWGRTPLADLMPVRCLETEDLVESTEGFSPAATREGRAFFGDLDVRTMPPLLGYNKTRRRPRATVLLEVAETGDPLLAVRAFGKGRVLAYTSDPAPHWGLNFVYWDGYAAFWRRCLDYARGGPVTPRAGRSPRSSTRPRARASARR